MIERPLLSAPVPGMPRVALGTLAATVLALFVAVALCLVLPAPQAHADKVKKTSTGYVYYNSKGKPAKAGYKVLKGKLYRVGKHGRCTTAAKVDGITYTKKGYAKKNTASELKIEVLNCLDRLTTKNMSRRAKLMAAFNWARHLRYANSTEPADIGEAGWVQRCALAVFRNNKSECYGVAAVTCVVGYELGFKSVLRERRHGHAISIVGGEVYDRGGLRVTAANSHDWQLVSWDATDPTGKVSKKLKQGLVREKKALRYYVDGERALSTWATVDGTRYYFDKTGAAVTGSRHLKVRNGATKKAWFVFDAKARLSKSKGVHRVKVNGTTYLAKANGRAKSGTYQGRTYQVNGMACQGILFEGKRFTAYTDSGKLRSKLTEKLRKASATGADAEKLLKLLGKPKSVEKQRSCYSPDVPGEDWFYRYGAYQVETFHADDGSEWVIEGVYVS